MAKRKTKTTRRRRHRVGAMSLAAGSPLVKGISIAAGYLLGDTVNQQLIDKLFGTPTDPVKTGKTIAIGQIGVGSALLFMKLGSKKSIVQDLAGGVLLGAGLKRAMVVFKAGATTMSGYGDVPVIGAYKTPGQLGRKPIAGYGDVPVIGAYNPASALNGTSKVMGGMNSNGSTLIG